MWYWGCTPFMGLWWIFPLMFIFCMVMMFVMMRFFFAGRFLCGMGRGPRRPNGVGDSGSGWRRNQDEKEG